MDVAGDQRTPVGRIARPREARSSETSFDARDWPLTALALDISGTCNLACRYCAEALTQPTPRAPMSNGVVDEAVALLMAGGRDPSEGSIRLGSGEPLLGLAALQHLEARLDEIRAQRGAAAQVFLTTNGTLADAEVRDWLVGTGWQVKVSLDGPASIHDRWRVTRRSAGTHAIVAGVVADLARRMPERLSVTTVLCRGADPADVFAAVEALGVRRIELVPAVHDDSDTIPGAGDIEAYQDFARAWVERFVAYAMAARATCEPAIDRPAELVRLVAAARRVMGYDRAVVSCGAGRTFFGVGPTGALYPCFRFVGLEEYRLGDVRAGVERSQAVRFRRGAGRPYQERSACRACDVGPLCAGPCFATAELNGPGNGEPFELQCAYLRIDAEAAIDLVHRVRGIDPERLLELLVLPAAATELLNRLA